MEWKNEVRAIRDEVELLRNNLSGDNRSKAQNIKEKLDKLADTYNKSSIEAQMNA